MIPDLRKKYLSELAAFVASEFSLNHITQLEQIAASESISVYYDNYGDEFDGMLVCDEEGSFHLHLNIDRGNTISSKRGRFTFSHELAHYYIEEHREPLRHGDIAPHGSLHDFNHNDQVEEEADFFAGCLLMPTISFRSVPTGRTFSLITILKLADVFKTSMLSTAIRFTEVGTHSICIVMSSENSMKWFAKSKDFPDWAFKCKVNKPLPPFTVAGEFYTKTDAKYTTVENIDQDSWFYSKWTINRQWHEQCFYSDAFGYVVSIIWYD